MVGRRLACLIAAASLAFTGTGCSFSYKLDSLFGSDKDSPPADYTGSAAATTLPKSGEPPDGLTDADLFLAKAAASEAVMRRGKDVSVPWENPATGARGAVTPIAATYSQNGFTCREFLASYVHESNETWLEGEACQMDEGRWEVRNLKPWKRS